MNLRCNEDGFKTEMSLVFTENAACKLRFSGFHHSIGSNYKIEYIVSAAQGHS